MKIISQLLHKTAFLLTGAVLLFSSCKKSYLDLAPYSSLPASKSITTVEDMQIAMNGAYAGLRSSNLYGRTTPLFGDLLADNVYISITNSNRYLDFFLVIYTASNGNAAGIWQSAYGVILDVNNVINSSLTGTPDIDQLRGEALCVRALMYFELVKFFSKPYTVDPNGLGVPLVLSYDPFLKPQRNTIGEVYTQIEKDLTDALSLLNIQKSSGYFTYYSAEALLARMHQFKGEWAEALAESEDIINNSGYQLLTLGQVQNYWASNTPRNDQVETLFEVVFDLVGNAGNDALAYFYDQSGGYGDALAADALYELYAPSDVRRSLILTFSPSRGDVKVVNKYPNSSQPDKDEFKVIRLSEVYLIAAEAAYHLNDEPKALAYLNTLAAERDFNFTPYASAGGALLSDIFLERRKELAFEGHRYWDLARYNEDVVRINLAGNYDNAPLVIPADYFRRILPIPQSELDANPNIRTQQNAGY